MFENRYNSLDKIIHRLALSNRNIISLLFNIEKFFFNKKKNFHDKNYFVTGLARSGTTQLLNSLYNTGMFSSYTYSDMPFIFSPNIWNKLSSFFKKKINEKTERAHRDGIKIDISSPEALEEPIWMHIKENEYIYNNYVQSHDLFKKDIIFYKQLINLVKIKYKKDRYLSKNNFNILRLKSLLEFFPNSHFFVIFRDPLEQSYSLHKQHINFTKLQKENKFILEYMNLLGHFDFGLNHKYYSFKNNIVDLDPNSFNYWLKIWIDVYEYASKLKDNKNIHFICYESLCEKKEKYFEKFIFDEKDIINKINLKDFESKNINIDKKNFDEKFLDRSLFLYESLKNYEN